MDSSVKKLLQREYWGVIGVLPLLVIAAACAIVLAPRMSSATANGLLAYVSPVSPVSPISPISPISAPPTREKVPPPKSVQPTKTPTPAPTATATVEPEPTELPPPTQPPPIPPMDVQEAASPPTLWLVLGLVVVGGVVAGLLVFKKK